MPDFAPENFINASYHGGSSTSLELPHHQPTPKMYLQFAIKDLEGLELERAWVNSLSNAKRALHYQVEIISRALGFEIIHSERAPFPKRLDFCKNCGVLSPRILTKINRLRNAIEHDYYIPTQDEAEDFVDVVELFLAATNRLIYRFPDSTDLADTIEGSDLLIQVNFVPNSGEVKIDVHPLKESGRYDSSRTTTILHKISSDEINYARWVEFVLQKSDT